MKNAKRFAICCNDCCMWFDTKDGWNAVKNKDNRQSCGACGCTVLIKKPYYEFLTINGKQGRGIKDLLLIKWPNGEYWINKRKERDNEK